MFDLYFKEYDTKLGKCFHAMVNGISIDSVHDFVLENRKISYEDWQDSVAQNIDDLYAKAKKFNEEMLDIKVKSEGVKLMNEKIKALVEQYNACKTDQEKIVLFRDIGLNDHDKSVTPEFYKAVYSDLMAVLMRNKPTPGSNKPLCLQDKK